MKDESLEAVEPDIEVIVRSGMQELAVIGVFQNKSDVWDMLIGVDDQERLDSLSTLFEVIVDALPIATFSKVHEPGGTQLGFLDGEPPINHYEYEKGKKSP